MKRAPYIILFCAATAPLCHAQRYILKDNRELVASEVTLVGTNLAKRVKLATGAEGVENTPISAVAALDFPMPDEFSKAREALADGDHATALANAEKVQAAFNLFRATPGSWYVAAAIVKLEALAAMKKLNEFDALIAELKAMTLSPTDQMYLKAMEAYVDYTKGVTGPAETKVRALLNANTTDDATLLARLWLMLGDIQFKREDFKAALESYLNVPVFYGSQGIYLPPAELGAARSMAKLQRYDEASAMFKGISERYKNSPQAADAVKEKAVVDKLLEGLPAGTTPETPAEKPAESQPAESQPAEAK